MKNNTDITKSEKIIEQPAPDPYRWRYIFGIVVSIILCRNCCLFCIPKNKDSNFNNYLFGFLFGYFDFILLIINVVCGAYEDRTRHL